MGRFNPSLLSNRWMTMVAGVWIMVSAGTSYLYSDYSTTIKSTLHYSQQTLDTVGFFKELGESVGLLSGLLYDVFPVYAVLLIGALQCSFGYLMAYLSVTNAIATPPVWAMSMFLCVGANGQTFFITAVLVSLVKRFPMSRGMVIGIMKGLVGLSAAVLTQFSKALYTKSESQGASVLLFLAWFPSGVVAVSYIFFREQPDGEEDAGNVISWFASLKIVKCVSPNSRKYFLVVRLTQVLSSTATLNFAEFYCRTGKSIQILLNSLYYPN